MRVCRAARENKPLATGHGGPCTTRDQTSHYTLGDGGGCSQQAERASCPSEAGCASAHSLTRHAISVLLPGRAARTYIYLQIQAQVPRTCRVRMSTRRSLSSRAGDRLMLACTSMSARSPVRAPPDRDSPPSFPTTLACLARSPRRLILLLG